MSFNKAKRSRLLEVVPESEIDPDMRALLQGLEQADGQCTTFLRGRVTGTVWVVHHAAGNSPPKKFIRNAEANEMAALPTAGSA